MHLFLTGCLPNDCHCTFLSDKSLSHQWVASILRQPVPKVSSWWNLLQNYRSQSYFKLQQKYFFWNSLIHQIYYRLDLYITIDTLFCRVGGGETYHKLFSLFLECNNNLKLTSLKILYLIAYKIYFHSLQSVEVYPPNPICKVNVPIVFSYVSSIIILPAVFVAYFVQYFSCYTVATYFNDIE